MEILACDTGQSAPPNAYPEELESQPFAHSDLVPDVYDVSRSFFAFTTREDNSAECVVGETSFRTAFSEAKVTNVTFISVVAVYDSYGLDVAQAYISRLRALPEERQAQVAIYLIGSLAILASTRAQPLYCERDGYQPSELVIVVCSVLLEELLALDERQPRLATPLEPVQIAIPDELLALICNSKRISKGIAIHVTQQRRNRALRPGELEFRAIHPRTKVLSDICWYIADSDSIWCLIRRPSDSGDIFLISTISRNDSLLRLGRVVIHSPRDHARLRGVSEPEMTKLLLDGVDRDDIDVVCGWVVQLMCELSERITVGEISSDLSASSTSGDETVDDESREVGCERLVIQEGVCLTKDDLLSLFSVLVEEMELLSLESD